MTPPPKRNPNRDAPGVPSLSRSSFLSASCCVAARSGASRRGIKQMGRGIEEAEGRGSREPIAANDSSWGRMLNQRVEFIRIP